MNYIAILALIQSLQRQVLVLENELIQMQTAQVATTTPMTFQYAYPPFYQTSTQVTPPQNIGYSNPQYVLPVETVVPTPQPVFAAAPQTDPIVNYECADAMWNVSIVGHPEQCANIRTTFPPMRTLTGYQSPTGTVYYQ